MIALNPLYVYLGSQQKEHYPIGPLPPEIFPPVGVLHLLKKLTNAPPMWPSSLLWTRACQSPPPHLDLSSDFKIKKQTNKSKSFTLCLMTVLIFPHQALVLQKPFSALLRHSVPAVNCGVVRLQSNGGSKQTTGTGNNGNSMQHMEQSSLFHTLLWSCTEMSKVQNP